jgi:hypothetical protein
MTWNYDHDRDEDAVLQAPEQGTWIGAAVAISVLVVATITLTLVAGGVDLTSSLLP